MDGEQPRVLALRPGVGLQGEGGEAGDLAQLGLVSPEELALALGLLGRREGVQVAGDSGHVSGSNALYARRRVELHGAGAQRDHGGRQREVALDALCRARLERPRGGAGRPPCCGTSRVRGLGAADDASDVGGEVVDVGNAGRPSACRSTRTARKPRPGGGRDGPRHGGGRGCALRVLGVSGDGHVAGRGAGCGAAATRRVSRRGTVELDRALRRNLLLALDDGTRACTREG